MAELKDVKGIGPKSLSLLNKININTIEDLVTHYPFRYDILERNTLSEVEDGERIVIDGKVESVPILMRFKAGLNKMNFRLVTASGVVGVSIFNRAFLKSQLGVGTGITVIGKLDKSKNVITASDIKMGMLTNKIKIEPVYHCTSGLTNKNLSTYINMALLMHGRDISDNIPQEYISKGIALTNNQYNKIIEFIETEIVGKTFTSQPIFDASFNVSGNYNGESFHIHNNKGFGNDEEGLYDKTKKLIETIKGEN